MVSDTDVAPRTGPRNRPTPAQWFSARASFERPDRDITVDQLAIQLGVTRNAVYSRSKKERWTKRIQKKNRIDDQIVDTAQAMVNTQASSVVNSCIANALPAISTYAETRIKAHFDSVLARVDKGLNLVDGLLGVCGDAAGAKELAISLDRFDTVARRTFGLDDNSNSSRRLPSRGVLHQPVLDAEIIAPKQIGNGSNT